MDAHFQPQEVVRSLAPRHNSFAFFEVSPKSFHQVDEVLTRDRTRLSIGGWFHADETLPRPPKYMEPARPTAPPGDIAEEDFFGWLNPLYLDPNNQGEIQGRSTSTLGNLHGHGSIREYS